MPNRIIKESICTSDQIDGLTASAECLFYRLMVNADDFGLFDGRLKVIASKCYPLKSIDINSVQADLALLLAAKLIFLYEVDDKPFLKLSGWDKHQQIRAKRAKYPLPEQGSAINCNQLISSASNCPRNPIQSNLIQSNPIQSNPI